MGDCQNYGPFLGPYYNMGPNTWPNLGDPKRDHNFDNPPCEVVHDFLHAQYHEALNPLPKSLQLFCDTGMVVRNSMLQGELKDSIGMFPGVLLTFMGSSQVRVHFGTANTKCRSIICHPNGPLILRTTQIVHIARSHCRQMFTLQVLNSMESGARE